MAVPKSNQPHVTNMSKPLFVTNHVPQNQTRGGRSGTNKHKENVVIQHTSIPAQRLIVALLWAWQCLLTVWRRKRAHSGDHPAHGVIMTELCCSPPATCDRSQQQGDARFVLDKQNQYKTVFHGINQLWRTVLITKKKANRKRSAQSF